MDYKLLMNTAIMAGEIMLRSGAETYRVEDTMYYILNTSKMEIVEANVMMTGIVATISNPEMEPITMIKRVQERGTNMNRILRVNEISRAYCGGSMSLEDAYRELQELGGKQYKTWFYNVATILIPSGFAPLFGGGLLEVLGAAMAGTMLAFVITVAKKLQIGGFILDAIAAFAVAITAMIVVQIFPVYNVDIVIISSIMPLVPGVAITNAVRDTLQGDYISGGARMLEAFLKAAALALGAGTGLALVRFIYQGGGLL